LIRIEQRDRRRRLVAAATSVAAIITLVSAASPPLRFRLVALLDLAPFVVTQSAAGLAGLAGAALLVTARGLRRGSRLAWWVALILLSALVVLHLLKGLDIEEAAVIAVVAGWLATQRAAFPVRPSRAAVVRASALGIGGAWLAVLLSVSLAVALGHGRHPRFGETSRQAAERLVGVEPARRAGLPPGVALGGGPAVAPVLPLVGSGLLAAALWLAFAPARAPRMNPDQHRHERERARTIIARYGRDTLAYFALRDDKDWFFSASSLVSHAVRGRVCLVSPDPQGPPDEADEVWDDFRAYAERNGWSVVVVGAAPAWLPRYERTGMQALYLGDEAILDCTTFSMAGSAMKGIRQACTRVRRAGIEISFHDPATLEPELRGQLMALSTQSRRGHAERGFSMTLSRLFDPADTGLLLTVARRGSAAPVGFVQWVPAPEIDGWSLDVMRRSTAPGVPNGVMEAVIAATAEHVRVRGGRALALNFAVLRSLVAGEQTGPLAQLGRRVVGRVARGSQMQSLWRFNAKFHPQWRPRWVVIDAVDQLAAVGLSVARAEGIADELPLVASWGDRLVPTRRLESRITARAGGHSRNTPSSSRTPPPATSTINTTPRRRGAGRTSRRYPR
jgi:lysyl-tRNA synthetase, class II